MNQALVSPAPSASTEDYLKAVFSLQQEGEDAVSTNDLAEKLGIADQDWITAETRRGSMTLRAHVVRTIRPDTIFIPYHWAGPKSANQLTVAAQDPISKIPQYKVCAARLRKADAAPEYATNREPQQ